MTPEDRHILELDCGNSSFKWRVIALESDSECGNPKAVNSGRLDNIDQFDSLVYELSAQNRLIAGCRAASVAGDAVNAQLNEIWQRIFESPIRFARVERSCNGVECGYDDLSQLGVDRWSAIIAAAANVASIDGARPFVVIDAGTALTADIVGEDRMHQGGYILPGLVLMLDALKEKTAIPDIRIPDVDSLKSRDPGRDSASAISSAVTSAVSAFTRYVCGLGGSRAKVLVTGGHAELVGSLCETEFDLQPDLVMDGLSYIVPI